MPDGEETTVFGHEIESGTTEPDTVEQGTKEEPDKLKIEPYEIPDLKPFVGKKMQIKYNHAGTEKTFNGTVLSADKNKVEIKQNFQTITLSPANILDGKIVEN